MLVVRDLLRPDVAVPARSAVQAPEEGTDEMKGLSKATLATQPYARAQRAIDRNEQIIYDVAGEHCQHVDNVKHMTWFLQKVAEEFEEAARCRGRHRVGKRYRCETGS